jgi:hypothetical protein
VTRRGRLLGLVAVAVAAAATLLASAPSGWADAPSAYGWWNEANAGLPVPPPAPPSVPPDGLYVANGISGPTAIAALTVPVPSGAAMGPLVLHVAGSPLMTQPPVACPLRSSFKPAEGGAWTDRPTYDCAQAQKVGSVDSAKTTVTFDASPFLRGGAVAVAILAGGPTDQVAFVKPGTDTLATSNVPGAVPAADVPAPPPADAASPLGSEAASALPALDTGAASALPPLAGPVAPGSLPSVAPSRGGTAATGGTFSQVGTVGSSHSGWRSRVGGVLGGIAVLLALVAWNEGYGLLGGRVRNLASPLGPVDPVKGPTRRIIRRPRRHRSA